MTPHGQVRAARRHVVKAMAEIRRPSDGVENLFRWQDQDQHEVGFVFSARFHDAAEYDIPEQRIRDDTRGYTRVIWRQPGPASPPLYPDGVSQRVDYRGYMNAQYEHHARLDAPTQRELRTVSAA